MEISVYDAIAQMRAITKLGGVFTFSFMSYSREKQSTHGIISVNKAKLRKAPNTGDKVVSDVMLHYTDDEGKAKRCYQPAIMTFNGQKCKLT